MPNPPPRWNKLSDYFLSRYGQRVQKIPLDAGFACPNRDGTHARAGCIFCNAQGSGTGFGRAGLNLAEQWTAWRQHFRAKGLRLFLAYLQSFSNTYGPIERLRAVLAELARLPDMIGVSVGTRPDCVDGDKLRLLADQPQAERWIEFGVQSACNATLVRIRRGHDRACAERAVALAAQAGLKVCVHLMAGLPGENDETFLASVRWVAAQPVAGVKFHCTYVCAGTALAALHAQGAYTPLTQTAYVRLMAEALPLLRPDIIVHRTTGDPFSGEMIAPDWVLRSRDTNNRILAELTRRGMWQGKTARK
ncbi:MAG: TIGR01212 family radical SAM protein [Deltaproteobacteria bacterium]|jgi:radical SAM protein (TIGR01212 family)|nr:TIGR01212 family radical SAM protein [Deltaproteobacteria bacterium]